MKKPFAFAAVVAISVSFSLPGIADAPIDQYELFTYDDTTITDHYTHLVWTRSSSNVLSTEGSIDNFCVAPSRLPTVKELLTIVDEVPNQRYDMTAMPPRTLSFYIDPNVFPDVVGRTDKPYCTQTREPATQTRYVVDFGTGTAGLYNGSGCHVRCVQFVMP